MKKHIIALVLLSSFSFTLSLGAPNEIVLRNTGQQDNHFEFPVPADQPDVYYDSDNQQIIIDGLGEVNYYDVEIASVSTWTVVISTQVNGYYDTIDVSSLPMGEYCITIDSPTGNSFEGFFDTY
ncbi:MAG: hypothetical protein IKZ92_09985 [Muribaculaceae bacterium]|nr:hypothetical protein [Muribaculaceae bacterium]